jgi:hypothetical protein
MLPAFLGEQRSAVITDSLASKYVVFSIVEHQPTQYTQQHHTCSHTLLFSHSAFFEASPSFQSMQHHVMIDQNPVHPVTAQKVYRTRCVSSKHCRESDLRDSIDRLTWCCIDSDYSV